MCSTAHSFMLTALKKAVFVNVLKQEVICRGRHSGAVVSSVSTVTSQQKDAVFGSS